MGQQQKTPFDDIRRQMREGQSRAFQASSQPASMASRPGAVGVDGAVDGAPMILGIKGRAVGADNKIYGKIDPEILTEIIQTTLYRSMLAPKLLDTCVGLDNLVLREGTRADALEDLLVRAINAIGLLMDTLPQHQRPGAEQQFGGLIRRAADATKGVYHRSPAPPFKPFTAWDHAIIQAVAEQCLRELMPTEDSSDWPDVNALEGIRLARSDDGAFLDMAYRADGVVVLSRYSISTAAYDRIGTVELGNTGDARRHEALSTQLNLGLVKRGDVWVVGQPLTGAGAR